ncbi:membrane protein [Christiangramia forsetii KT0803]|uniref:Membrane protein n=2 Tax=Christiangramia forsetii TaxID=411153 RepID=A0LZR9_CHRFK|nr:membrane protein [Christiangramia forsetii KT0803]
MNRYLKFTLELIFLVFIILLIYILSIDFVVFNRFFLQIEYFDWLFYLLPILLSFLYLIVAVVFKNKSRILKLIFLTFSIIYLALSIFMITGIYCEEEKNLGLAHILLVLLIAFVMIGIHYKILFPSLSKIDKLLVVLSSLIILAELYFNLFSYDLFYVNLLN